MGSCWRWSRSSSAESAHTNSASCAPRQSPALQADLREITGEFTCLTQLPLNPLWLLSALKYTRFVPAFLSDLSSSSPAVNFYLKSILVQNWFQIIFWHKTQKLPSLGPVLQSLLWTFTSTNGWPDLSAAISFWRIFSFSLPNLLIPNPGSQNQRITKPSTLSSQAVWGPSAPGTDLKRKNLRKDGAVELGWPWNCSHVLLLCPFNFPLICGYSVSTRGWVLIAVSNIYGNTIATSPQCSKSVPSVIITLINSQMLAMLNLLIKFQLDFVTRQN